MDFDALMLARIQFAFVISFHIIFPTFTIGLASWLMMLEALWLLTAKSIYRRLSKMWTKVFAVSFGMGVVSGIVMSFQIGTNWSVFSEMTGNVLGPLFSYEVLTAFFLEATFLGIMLFGRNRVSRWFYFTATTMVALGTLFSAFWILSANSWMHTPDGYEIRNGVFFPVDWWAIVFNPSFPYRLVHMVLGAYLATAFFILGTSAWYLRRNLAFESARIMQAMGIIFITLVVPLQIFVGDLHGLNTQTYQPAKVAAMEAYWETQSAAPFNLFAIPDQTNQNNKFAVAIPRLGSLILTHSLDGEVIGLDQFPAEEQPPVLPIFFSFRLMVGIGLLMLATALIGCRLAWQKRLFSSRNFHLWCMLMSPAGFIAVLAGWVTTEMGRQPYVVYGLLRTADAVTPALGASSVGTTLGVYGLVYTFIFTAGSYFIYQLLRIGPDAGDKEPVRSNIAGSDITGAES